MTCSSFTASDDHPNKCTCGDWLSAHLRAALAAAAGHDDDDDDD